MRILILSLFLVIAKNGLAATSNLDRSVLFRAGEGGYASYRIPAVVGLEGKYILAFCEGRKKSAGDSGEINLLVRRSEDGGKTFEPMEIVWADGDNTCGNPCPVVDQDAQVVWLLMTHNLGQDHEREITAGTSAESRTVWITSSSDFGKTWAPPRDITAEVKKADWAWYATGPGIGIQIQRGEHKGRLVVPCDYVLKGGGSGGGNSHVIYSDDHGRTWKIGGQPPEHRFNESQVVELEGGDLMLNMRNARTKKSAEEHHGRGVAISRDGGETFGPAREDSTLIEPICQGSILRYAWATGPMPGIILFANPASTKNRAGMTVRMSRDDGATWPVERVVWEGPSAYSCMTRLPDGDIGLLYEAGEKKSNDWIEWDRFPLDWLTAKN